MPLTAPSVSFALSTQDNWSTIDVDAVIALAQDDGVDSILLTYDILDGGNNLLNYNVSVNATVGATLPLTVRLAAPSGGWQKDYQIKVHLIRAYAHKDGDNPSFQIEPDDLPDFANNYPSLTAGQDTIWQPSGEVAGSYTPGVQIDASIGDCENFVVARFRVYLGPNLQDDSGTVGHSTTYLYPSDGDLANGTTYTVTAEQGRPFGRAYVFCGANTTDIAISRPTYPEVEPPVITLETLDPVNDSIEAFKITLSAGDALSVNGRFHWSVKRGGVEIQSSGMDSDYSEMPYDNQGQVQFTQANNANNGPYQAGDVITVKAKSTRPLHNGDVIQVSDEETQSLTV